MQTENIGILERLRIAFNIMRGKGEYCTAQEQVDYHNTFNKALIMLKRENTLIEYHKEANRVAVNALIEKDKTIEKLKEEIQTLKGESTDEIKAS